MNGFTKTKCVSLATCKANQDTLRFLIPSCGFQIPDTVFRIFCQWNLDSGFLELNYASKAQDSGFYTQKCTVLFLNIFFCCFSVKVCILFSLLPNDSKLAKYAKQSYTDLYCSGFKSFLPL